MPSEPWLPDLTATIEACYRVEQSRREWLQGVLTALGGVLGFTYTVDTNHNALPEVIVQADPQDALLLPAALSHSPLYLTQDVGVIATLDCSFINGRNSDNHNVVILFRRAHGASLPRIARHLAAGARLQRLCQGALKDEPPAPVSKQPLSAREREIMVAAVLGHSNKEIAFALGVAPSTIRVLFARAAKKLGVRDRREAVQRFAGADWSAYQPDHGSSVGSS